MVFGESLRGLSSVLSPVLEKRVQKERRRTDTRDGTEGLQPGRGTPHWGWDTTPDAQSTIQANVTVLKLTGTNTESQFRV